LLHLKNEKEKGLGQGGLSSKIQTGMQNNQGVICNNRRQKAIKTRKYLYGSHFRKGRKGRRCSIVVRGIAISPDGINQHIANVLTRTKRGESCAISTAGRVKRRAGGRSYERCRDHSREIRSSRMAQMKGRGWDGLNYCLFAKCSERKRSVRPIA